MPQVCAHKTIIRPGNIPKAYLIPLPRHAEADENHSCQSYPKTFMLYLLSGALLFAR